MVCCLGLACFAVLDAVGRQNQTVNSVVSEVNFVGWGRDRAAIDYESWNTFSDVDLHVGHVFAAFYLSDSVVFEGRN